MFVYSSPNLLIEPGPFHDKWRKNLLRFLFLRALLDPSEYVRTLIAESLLSIDANWVTQTLENIDKKGYVVLEKMGYIVSMIPLDMRTNHIPMIPDERKLANRVTQFKAVIKLSLSESGRRKGPTVLKPSANIELVCVGCGRRYFLGQNAVVVTAEGVLSDFPVGTTIGEPSAPDLVGSADWESLDDSTRQGQAVEIKRVVDAIHEGRVRQWRCKECGKVQAIRANPGVVWVTA